MKAIIPAAGHGTRFYPLAKSVTKEMLPVLGKPAIQWIVEEAIEAGADEVIIITSSDKPAITRHFTPDDTLAERLKGRAEAVEALSHLDALSSKVRFVEQREQRGLGHAVLQAAPLLLSGEGPILILLGDAVVAGANASCELVACSRAHGGASVVGLEPVPLERVSRYGIVAGQADARGGLRLTDIVEKPVPEEAPSRLAVAGRYLLDARVLDFLAEERVGKGGEIQLTDAIRMMLSEEPVYGLAYSGRRHDIGNPAGYLEALNNFSTTEAVAVDSGQGQ
jgi:UTP--glucose-1-phosphate uridylyltransferase